MSGVDVLPALRAARGFDVHEVFAAKRARLDRFFGDSQLDAAVVGVSGGVDSALVLALLRQVPSIRRVVALVLPIHARGATGQVEATEHGLRVARALGAEAWLAPLGEAHGALVRALERGAELPFDAWAEGQALSVMRTPALYGAAALLQAHGFRSIVVGTTNRDEGAYLGFFGKASDGMVDLQPISDLHKSEVRALARHLHVPADVIDRAPTGDTFDGRTDEAMIGASYDDVECFLRLRESGHVLHDARWSERADCIERLHAQNAHKYAVGNASVHLDVMPRGVPGGWDDERLSGRGESRPPPSAVPGAWEPPPIALDPIGEVPRRERLSGPAGFAILARGVLRPSECGRLVDAMADAPTEDVGVTGLRDVSKGKGSVRATAFSPELAASLGQRLLPVLPCVRFLGESDPTDHFATASRTGHRSWRRVGLSPLLRFMRYERGGHHYGHYDAGFDYGDGRRTLLSVVFYLTDLEAIGIGGATRFLRDGQESVPVRERCFDDHAQEAAPDEVVCSVRPRAGDVLVFDHRLCHDVERFHGDARVIIRADVVYEAIPDGR